MKTINNSDLKISILTILFLATCIGISIFSDIWYFMLLPITFILGYIAIRRLDIFFYICLFLIPLSLPLSDFVPQLSINISLPSEIFIIIIFLLFVVNVLNSNYKVSKILMHPISLLIIIHLLWMLITTITSTLPLVSLKYLLSRTWFVVAFYFFPLVLFTRLSNIKKYFSLYSLGMLVIIIYAINKMSAFGFSNQQAAHLASTPFFNDHTAFGAALAFILPISFTFLLLSKKFSIKWWSFLGLVLLIFFSIITCYTRATWLGVAIAIGFSLILYFKIKLKYVFVVLISIFALIWSFQDQIMHSIERNRNNSSGNYMKHLQSMFNVSTDVSNLERLNRWKCAMAMHDLKPMMGWGPGTFQFEYGAFQHANDFTEISTFAGDAGNAHSEYLGPLAEQGIAGMLIFISIIIATFWIGYKNYIRTSHRTIKILLFAALFGLITYYIHGILNVFLDIDKLSALFWGFTSIIVAIDMKNQLTLRQAQCPKYGG